MSTTDGWTRAELSTEVNRLTAERDRLREALRGLLAYAEGYSDAMAKELGRGAEQLGENSPSWGVAGMARAALALAEPGDSHVVRSGNTITHAYVRIGDETTELVPKEKTIGNA